MSDSSDLDQQRGYYDHRWSQEIYANLLQLQRAVTILDALRSLNLRYPSILDLGCGNGWLAGILGRFGPTTGIELSPVAVQNAKIKYPDVQFIAADFLSLPASCEAYDVVISQEVIEHLEDQRAFVDLLSRLLRPRGHLILTTPNAWNLAHWTREKLENWGLQPIENWLNRKQLKSLLEPRFKIICQRTIILGHGTRGWFRVANSVKVASVLRALHLLKPYESLLERAGFGLQIFLVAQLSGSKSKVQVLQQSR